MGSTLDISGLRKSFGEKVVLDDVSLSLADGEFTSLLGPSGCGKTTTLNLVAGFFAPDAGSISLDGRDITHLPTHRRGLSMVFQSYALFPHMTIADNIGFGLRMRGEKPATIAGRVDEMLELVRLPGVGPRYPRQLSGGQQQRIGLARALAFHPGLLLLDEPMSNLDAKLRRHMQLELREILQQVGTTTLYVTHDQEEALAMSDRVVVMNEGHIEQIGVPADIYHRPRSAFVAGFVGDSNILEGTVFSVDGAHAEIQLAPGRSVRASLGGDSRRVGDRVRLLVRPEHIQVRPADLEGWPATIATVAFGGASVRLRIQVPGLPPLECQETSDAVGDVRVGSAVSLVIADRASYVLPDMQGPLR